MRSPRRTDQRQGMTLLEVLLALAIFLFSLAAISQLFTFATHQANEIQQQSRSTRLAQSKLGEYIAGVTSLTNGSGTCDDEPEFQWQSSVSDGGAQNLYLVTVTVSRDTPHIETSLTQYILDPRSKGNFPAPPSTSDSSSDSTTTAAAPAATPAATPAPAASPASSGGGGSSPAPVKAAGGGGGGSMGGGAAGGKGSAPAAPAGKGGS